MASSSNKRASKNGKERTMNPKSHLTQLAEMQGSQIFPNKLSDPLRLEILELRNTIERSYLRLAELLSKVRHQELYLQ